MAPYHKSTSFEQRNMGSVLGIDCHLGHSLYLSLHTLCPENYIIIIPGIMTYLHVPFCMQYMLYRLLYTCRFLCIHGGCISQSYGACMKVRERVSLTHGGRVNYLHSSPPGFTVLRVTLLQLPLILHPAPTHPHTSLVLLYPSIQLVGSIHRDL